MARPIVVSNGEMLVGINRYGLVHDFYYPYVGQDNHANAKNLRHRIGVWIDGQFSWFDDDSWKVELSYEPNTLTGVVKARHAGLNVELVSRDFVDPEDTVFARTITVHNLAKKAREIRVFMHQVFQIADSNKGDTARFHPQDDVIVHYKGRRAFAIYAEHDGKAFDQYSIGIHGIEGKEGTYRDAEDGELAGNPVEHGMVDSVMRLKLQVGASASADLNYWIAAARHPEAAIKLHHEFKDEGVSARRQASVDAWAEWLDASSDRIAQLPEDQQFGVQRSLMLIKSHIDQRGGILASADSDMLNYGRDYYGYCWPRDAVYALWPLMQLGYTDEVKNFFEFAGRVRHQDGYMMHKYQMDGALGSSWHPYIHDGQPELPIQEDETAAVVWLVDKYHEAFDDHDYVRELYDVLVRPAANFMSEYIDEVTKLPHSSYDLWEQTFGVHTYTVAITYAALVAAARLAKTYGTVKESKRWQKVADAIKKAARKELWNETTGCFYRNLTVKNGKVSVDATIDISSVYGVVMYGLFDHEDPMVTRAIATVGERLKIGIPGGYGITRCEDDNYYRVNPDSIGNPWIITTLWMAKLYAVAGNEDQAQVLVKSALSVMTPSGTLPEQVDPSTGKHISVSPLTWSQAEMVDTVLYLNPIQNQTRSGEVKVKISFG